MESKRNQKKCGFLYGIILVIVAAYLWLSVFFMERFFPGTVINGIDCGMATAEEAKERILEQTEAIPLTLIARGGTETISMDAFGGSFELELEIQQLKRMQNGFSWPSLLWKQDTWTVTPEVVIDEACFSTAIQQLACLQNQEAPQNAEIVFTDYGFKVKQETLGNTIKEEVLFEAVRQAMIQGESELDLETIGCYEEPKIRKDSDEIQSIVKQLIPVFSAKVTYEIGEEPLVIDVARLQEWVTIEDGQFSLKEEEIQAYVDEMADTYDSEKTKRVFYGTLQGRMVLTDSKHRWQIDRVKEKEALLKCIKEGGTIHREPYYLVPSGSYMGSEIGDTYVEVDMTAQHLWLYRDGELVLDTDVVTGNVRGGTQTPEILAYIYALQRNRTLRGPGYATFVKYWAPFYRGYGLHDANWRGSFGGNIYTYDGSHGCVNIPPSVMPDVYENLELGMPVITYY